MRQPLYFFCNGNNNLSCNRYIRYNTEIGVCNVAIMTLSEILQVEKTISDMIQQIKEQIAEEVKETPVSGVNKIGQSVFTIRLSTLKNHDVWTPEYYNNVSQADIVAKAFSGTKTTSAFVTKAKDMILNQHAVVRDSGFTVTYRLNDTTVSIIRKYCGEMEEI